MLTPENTSFFEKISFLFPVFTFSLIYAKNKRYTWGLFFAMFLPALQIIILLNFIEEDLSGGYFYIWYYRIYFRVGLFFLTSLVALLVGTGMFSDMKSDETVVYIMTKPIDRTRIFMETYVAYVINVIIITTPGLVVSHITAEIATRMYDNSFSLTITETFLNMGLELLAAYIVLLGLGAVFVTTGLWLKRPLLVNLLIAFGVIIEAFLLDLIANRFEPVYIAQNLVAKELKGFDSDQELINQLLRFSLGPEISTFDGLGNFLTILVLTLIVGFIIAKRKQFD